mmetsp:Transcript_50850/g.115822  ORF Transcript_50850/g.115822 Transcript_50850/m.115822 type:complete len:265 (-) Transcript_50850:249-1043(-)
MAEAGRSESLAMCCRRVPRACAPGLPSCERPTFIVAELEGLRNTRDLRRVSCRAIAPMASSKFITISPLDERRRRCPGPPRGGLRPADVTRRREESSMASLSCPCSITSSLRPASSGPTNRARTPLEGRCLVRRGWEKRRTSARTSSSSWIEVSACSVEPVGSSSTLSGRAASRSSRAFIRANSPLRNSTNTSGSEPPGEKLSARVRSVLENCEKLIAPSLPPAATQSTSAARHAPCGFAAQSSGTRCSYKSALRERNEAVSIM